MSSKTFTFHHDEFKMVGVVLVEPMCVWLVEPVFASLFVYVCVCEIGRGENAINRGPFHRKLPSNRGRTCNGGPSTVAILVFAV